ncbi:leucine-rich repeat domain-containing protein [Thiocapsa bogorovii]|uniref:hypothetical protein n=1 Tax=Thiocapsa bogorovii TaxID=521689 RepID=UPI001E367C87|nr:hypothetical protein [Thiocapsa bogorovii]UHD17686.1 hypothetical protein LT988_06455 [Thiocapsa bogorovii]
MNESHLFMLTSAGFALLVVSWIWVAVVAWRRSRPWGVAVAVIPPVGLLFGAARFHAVRGPLVMGLAGALLVGGPPVVNRLLPVDLGPRDVLVDGERHVTLTGWDRHDYRVLDGATDVVVLQMANPDVTDETLERLAGMDRLRELDLNDSGVTDAGLARLAGLTRLERLRLANTGITDAGFRAVLMPLPGVLELDLRGTSVSGETLSAWRKAKPGRRVLH